MARTVRRGTFQSTGMTTRYASTILDGLIDGNLGVLLEMMDFLPEMMDFLLKCSIGMTISRYSRGS